MLEIRKCINENGKSKQTETLVRARVDDEISVKMPQDWGYNR